MENPQFRDIDGALKFAFSYYDYEQYQRTSMAIMAGGPQPEGKGLSGFDGAATIGILFTHLGQIPQLWRRILLARFMPRTSECLSCASKIDHPRWLGEIDWISYALVDVLDSNVPPYKLRTACVMKYFESRKRGKQGILGNDHSAVRIADVADVCRIHRNTAARHYDRIKAILKQEEKQAYNAFDERLRSAGLVGEPGSIQVEIARAA